MNCPSCSRNLETDSSFCRFCGTSVDSPSTPPRRLVRVPHDGHVAGVCAGVADYFDVDVTLIRLAWVALSIVPGVLVGGVIAYAVAWAILPAAAPDEASAYAGTRLLRSGDDRYLSGVCGGIADYLHVDSTIVRVAAVILTIYPGAIIGGLIAYAVAWIVIPDGAPGEVAPTHG